MDPTKSPSGPVLDIENLVLEYVSGSARRIAAREVSLAVERGASVGIVGESGSGKSTLARAVLGLLPENVGFVRSGSKNKLLPEHQQKILDAFVQRKSIDHFARLVDNGDIAANSYNIAVSSYVEQADTSEAIDITALNAEIARIVARQAELRTQIDAIVADLEGEQE